MLLSKLLNELNYVSITGDENINITGVSIDSKKVQKGQVFVCISGCNYDSHNAIYEAEKYGAKAIVCEKDVDTNLTKILVKDTRKALSKISANFYGNASKNMKIIGVTGTNGKTTTAHVIKNILEACGKKVGLIGTLGVFFGSTFYEPTLTTPDPIELHKIFSEMYNYGIDYVVMEVSAHAIALSKIEDVKFEVGVFTNLSQDHLDYFEDMENYKQTKLSFLTGGYCKYVIVNNDDEVGRQLSQEDSSYLSYGIKNPSDVFAINIKEKIDGTNFVLNLFDNVYKIKLPLLGEFNVYNALAASLCVGALGLGSEKIVEALNKCKPVEGRLELVSTKNGVNVFVDYAHTPDGLKNSLLALRKITEKKLICVFGCGGNRDEIKRSIMGEISGVNADFTVITSDNPRFEEPMDIIRSIESGVLNKTKEFVSIQKREKAIEYALEIAKKGDTVLIAGKGAEKYQDILGIKHLYNDKDCIKNYYREYRI